MKIIFVLLMFAGNPAQAQLNKAKRIQHSWQNDKYITFNPLALAESPIAIGAGFGNRFSERSEYFAELAYTAKAPLYSDIVKSLNGIRFIGQYHYHFLQQWKPILNIGFNKNRGKNDPFMAAEFRFKNFSFSDTRSLVNVTTLDTLYGFNYKANATVIGGAILFGGTYNLSSNGNLQLEISAGIGARQKGVKLKNAPAGYKIYHVPPREWGLVPKIYEERGMPYFPVAFRLRYIIN